MAARRRAAVEEGSKLDPNAWMATFSDLLTLMLTFFVLLLSMSSMDDRALRDTFGFFHDRMGLLKRTADPEIRQEASLPVVAFLSQQIFSELEGAAHEKSGQSERLSAHLEHMIDENNLEDLLQVRPVPGGVTITVAAEVLFGPQGQNLRPEGLPVLDALADLLGSSAHLHLRISGVEQRPGDGLDPWQLATDRALAVLGYLQSAAGVDPHQLALAGYGPGFAWEGLPGSESKIELTLTWYEDALRGP